MSQRPNDHDNLKLDNCLAENMKQRSKERWLKWLTLEQCDGLNEKRTGQRIEMESTLRTTNSCNVAVVLSKTRERQWKRGEGTHV